MHELSLPFEPAGKRYDELLLFLAIWARSASLVVETRRPANPKIYMGLAERLEHFRIERRIVTDDISVPARPRVLFRYDSDSISLLQRTARCLYSWQLPYLPEDLILYREDGSLLLGSIGHEYDAWLSLSDEECREWAARFPQADQVSLPQLALGADRVKVEGDAGALLAFARRLREPPTPGVLVLPRRGGTVFAVEIRVEPQAVRDSWIGREGDRVIFSGDSLNLDILAEEILTFVAVACSPARTSDRLVLVPYDGHPYLRPDSLALEIVLT